MTIDEIIERVDHAKPNAWDEDAKGRWVLEVERRLRQEFYPRYAEDSPAGGPVEWPDDRDVPLLASGPWEELYCFWLEARIDYANQEIESYNNAMTLFNATMDEYRKDYHQTHTPKNAGGFRT